MQRKRCKLKLDINIKIVIKIYSPKIKVFVSHSRHDIESIFMLLFHFSFCSLQYYAQWQKAKVYNAGLALSKHMGHHSKVQYHFKQWCTIYRHHSIVLESIHITVIWIVLLQILFMYLYSSNFFVYSSCLFYFLGSNKNSFYSFWLYHYKPSLKKWIQMIFKCLNKSMWNSLSVDYLYHEKLLIILLSVITIFFI